MIDPSPIKILICQPCFFYAHPWLSGKVALFTENLPPHVLLVSDDEQNYAIGKTLPDKLDQYCGVLFTKRSKVGG